MSEPTLDFEAAQLEAHRPGGPSYEYALQHQHQRLLAAAVAQTREEERERGAALVAAAERWHELWAQDQRYTIWENTPEGQATHWAVSEEECAEFASDAFDCDKMRDDLAEAERTLINAYETAKYGKSTSDTVSEVLRGMLP